MDTLSRFENQEQKQRFKKILREFFSVLLSVGLIVLMLYFFGGFYKKKGKVYLCQAETVVSHNKKKFFKRDGVFFAGGDQQSGEQAHSHKYSIKLTKEHPYGFNFKIPAADGDEDLWISVWRYNPDGSAKKGKLVCSSKDYYKATSEVKVTQDSGWEKLSMRANLPQSVRNELVQVYCQHDGEAPVYFDDLEIDFRRKDK